MFPAVRIFEHTLHAGDPVDWILINPVLYPHYDRQSSVMNRYYQRKGG